MDFNKIARKLIQNRQSNDGEPNRRLSADEIELASFKERERRDNIKRELDVYRKQESSNLFKGKSILIEDKKKGTILESKNVMLKRRGLL